MTRIQKKCFIASVGMHVLLVLILIGNAAFRSKPKDQDIPILTMIPANIVDRAGAGGGSPEETQAAPPAAPAHEAAQPQQQPQLRETKVTPQPMPREPKPQPVPERKPEPEPEPVRERRPEPSKEVEAAPVHKEHEIRPTFDPIKPIHVKQQKNKSAQTENPADSANAHATRLSKEVAQSLDALASGVKNSAASGTPVDMPGQGGGEAFVGYETVIYNAYYHAWITPDSVANKLASADVKIVVAKDGTILSAEIISKSGEPALDKSVERALRAVQSLPPFPAGAHDEQRTFKLRFNLESKESSG